MKHIKKIILSLVLSGIMIAALGSVHCALAADVKRIALLPFKINSEKDLSFLGDGIFDMLSTRLAKEGQVEVISRAQVDAAMQSTAASGAVNEAAARSIGTRLNADFVLFGSLTVLGENVSIDSKMVDISGSQPTMTFFDQSQDLGAVITKINLMAVDINDKIFGRQTQTKAKAPPAAQPTPAKRADIHAHPESVLEDDGFIGQGKQAAADSSGIISAATGESQAQFWKSANFKYLINGVALGDVDGDGKIETVTITPDGVIIFRSEGGQFRKITEIGASSSKNLAAVDVADINDNGFAEIFVTSFNPQKTMLNSYVLEFDGTNFTKIVDGSYWIYRVANTPARGKILLGQRPRIGKSFSGTISEMTWQNGEYVPSADIKTPRTTNLLGLTLGDVLNSDQESAIAYRDNDHIRIIDPSGGTLWESPERFGGSMMYYDAPWNDRGQIENKQYFPMRLVVWQNLAKKESEVIAVKNHDLTDRKLTFRKFTKTHIESFSWDGVGLRPNWKTRTMAGYIPDYSVGDYDNDGQDELVAALILKEGAVVLLTEPKSTIIAYELSSPQKPES
ncbi:MAG: FG-GAP-like repeat-containing protein [Desulfobacterales bacterium]